MNWFNWLQLYRLRSDVVRRIIRFVIVGSIGFLVDGGIVTLLVEIINLNPFISRAISFPAAVTVTWLLNRRWTFAADASARKKTEYGRYFTIQIIGAAINLAIYFILITNIPSLGVHPIFPLAVGSLVAMTFNFLGCQLFVFRSTASRNG